MLRLGVGGTGEGVAFSSGGVDSLNVVRHVARLVDGFMLSRPFPLVKDGELVA